MANCLGNLRGQLKIDELIPLLPSSEPSKFSIIAIIGKTHLGSYDKNLSIETENLTIVALGGFDNGHAEATHNAIGPIPNQ